MDDKLFAVLSTLAGLVLGWTLNELSDLFKAKRENKKILNQTLYVQFEIRNIILKTDLDNVEKQLEEVLKRKYPNEDIAILKDTEGKIFYGFIQNELNKNFSNNIPELILNYKNLVSSLSQVDPFTTYYISGKDTILDFLGYISEYLKKIEPYLTQPVIERDSDVSKESITTFKATFDTIKNQLTPFLRKSATETIESDIKIISKRIGLIRYLKTKRFLKRSEVNKFDTDDIKKIESYLSQF